MTFLFRGAPPPDIAFVAAGESARSLVQDTDETDDAYWGRVGRAAIDAYRSAATPEADAKRILNLLMPFAESAERNRDFAAVAREVTHFIRDISLFAEPMTIEPKQPAPGLGIKIATMTAITALGIAFFVYWPQINALLNQG